MPDLRTAARLALWLLRNRWLSSLIVLCACLATAVLASRMAHLAGIQPWIVITLATVALTGGFVKRQSRGWTRWSQRLPVDPRSVWGAQWVWLVLLALPAILSVGFHPASQPSSVMSADPDFNWALCARSSAWLLCLAAAFVAPGSREDRVPFLGGLAAWLIAAELCSSSLGIAETGVVLHDLALAAVTTGYLLASVGQRQEADLSGIRFLLFGFMLLSIHQLPLVIPAAGLGLVIVGWSALVRAGFIPRLRSAQKINASVVGGWLLISAASLAFSSLLLIWPLVRFLSDWETAKLELMYAVGRGPWVTSSRLMGAVFVVWTVVLVRGELKRSRAVERWKRRRALLERMPLTRRLVVARAIMPQLEIAAAHGLLVLIIGLIAEGVYRLLELEGVSQIRHWGAMVLLANFAYLLVAQLFIFRRGLDRLPWIAAILAVIAWWTSVSQVPWPFILTVTVIALAGTSVALSRLRSPADDARERYSQARAELQRLQSIIEYQQPGTGSDNRS